SSGNLALDLTGKVKFGTADFDQGLGTGEQDYSLQAGLFRFFDRFTAIGTAGYTVRGDPDDVDLDDQFFASRSSTYPRRRSACTRSSPDWPNSACRSCCSTTASRTARGSTCPTS
ncbi:MAG: hypothetical protein R6X13_06605, partial [bacterium]